MASFRKNEDSSDDDFSVNLKLTERLRINRENKLGNFQKKNLMDDQSSSSSSLEINNESHKPGTSKSYCPHNKKRQNGDKNAELLANPKRTCLSNRFPRSDNQNKKKSNPAQVHIPAFPHCSPEPSRKLFADKTYEDHLLNLTDGHASAFKPVKQYSKKSIFSNLEDKSRPVEPINYCTTKVPEYIKTQKSQKEFSKAVNSDRDPSKQFLWRAPQNDTEHSRSARNKNVKPVSYTAPAKEFYKDAPPNMAGNGLVHYVDSASDEDSRSMVKSGSLKGGRQSPELSQSHKKVVGRKVKKKVLDSDDDTDDDWLSGNRSRPCLVFSSSDSEVESTNRKGAQKPPASSKNNVNHSFPVGEGACSKKEFQSQMPRDYQEACYSRDNSFANPTTPLVYHSKSPARSFRNRKHSRSNAVPDLPSNNFHYNRNPGTAARGRNRVNVGERYARRSGSPHPRTLPNSLPRMTRPDAPKSSKGRSLTGSHVRRPNMNLATTHPDIFDAEDNSSEVEFFTANSYSDTETSAESFGGLRISTTVRNPENNGVICEHSINVGSSEDEISVVFSSGPNVESRVESQVVRNGESRRGPRNLGRRRRNRSPWTQFQELVREYEALPPSPDPVAQVRQVQDDETFARMLQAQFDAEADPTYESPLPPVIYPPYNVSSFVNTTTDDTDNEFHWDFHPVDLDATLQYRARRLSMGHHTPTVGSMLYNNRRLSRNRRRRESDIRQDLARVIHNGLFGYNDLLSSDDSYETFLGIAELNGDVPRGLQRNEINRLPTRKFVAANSEGSGELPHKRAGLNKECQVCLTDYVNGDTLRILPCFHEFHTPCIDPWLKINHTCPVCRVAVDVDG